VWLTGQVCPRDQRKRRYVPGSNAHPAKMYPATARKLVTTYTRPGELVFDPMAGIGTTIIEAIHLGRDGVGVEYEPRWARLAVAGIDHAHTQDATGTGHVVSGDARQLPHLLTTAEATTWLNEHGPRPGSDITATVLPLHTPVLHPSWTAAQRRRDDPAAGTGQHEQPDTAPLAAPTAPRAVAAAGSPPSRRPTTPHRSTTT
jgi:hypothetical protein